MINPKPITGLEDSINIGDVRRQMRELVCQSLGVPGWMLGAVPDAGSVLEAWCFQSYARWYNAHHPHRKVNPKRLSRPQKAEAIRLWQKRGY